MRSAAAFACLSLLLVRPVPSAAQPAPARPSAPAASAPVLLRHRFTAGEHHRYAIRSTSTAPAPVGRMTTSMHSDLETVSVRPDGSAVLRNHVTNVDMSGGVITPAMSRQVRQGMEGMTIEMTQDTRGSVVTQGEVTGVSAQMRPMVSGVTQSMEQLAVQFPENPLRVGESWTQQRSTHVPLGPLGTLDMNVNTTYTLRAVRRVRGARQADIGVATTVTMERPLVIRGVSITGSGDGTGTMVFDVDAGLSRSATTHLTMTIHAGAGGPNMQTVADSEVRLEGAP